MSDWTISHSKNSVECVHHQLLNALVCFFGISTILGYLMPNPFYTYIRGAYNKFPDFLKYGNLKL